MNPVFRTALHALAAIPALFLPFAYFVMFGWAAVYALPAMYAGEATPQPGGWFFSVSRTGFYALMAQWPSYLVWILSTGRLTPRLRLLWAGVLLVFSVFAIPWFLRAMFRGTERIELIRFIRRRSVRRYFAHGLIRELPPPPPEPRDLPAAYRRVRFRCELEDLPPEFRIVTAWNPDGEIADEADNRAADEHLRQEIARLEYEAFPVTGGDPEFTHAEPGFGIVCNRAEAVLLARRFRQLAFYEVLGGRVHLVATHDGHSPGEPVGRWSDLRERATPAEVPGEKA